MKRESLKDIVKFLAFGLFGVVVFVLMAATILEKIHSTELVLSKIYTAPWMIALWTVATVCSLAHIILSGLHRRLRIVVLHLSFVVILVGALTTHLTGREGAFHLREGESVDEFMLRDGRPHKFGFWVTLDDFELRYYDGTFAPMDYVSHLRLSDEAGSVEGVVSMNNILRHKEFRIYQAGYDADAEGATLMVQHDPYGIAITYAGYIMLLLSFILFFFDRNSMFRKLLRHPSLRRLSVVVLFVLLTPLGVLAHESPLPRTLSPEAADSFCDVLVYHNHRIAPLETLAIEFTQKLTGKAEYRGLSAEQVFVGWYLFADDWTEEPMIKIKGEAVRRELGIEGGYARLVDFIGNDGYKLDNMLRSDSRSLRQSAELATEKFSLVSMLSMGTLLRVFPSTDAQSGDTVWYSPTDELPATMSGDEQLLVRKSLALVAQAAAGGDEQRVIEMMNDIARYQRSVAHALPSERKIAAERLYNSINYNRPLAMSCLTLGILSLLWLINLRREGRGVRVLRSLLYTFLVALALYLSLHIALRYYISGHIPLANGYETMQFMAWSSVVITLAIARRFPLALPFGLLVAGFTLLVAMLGEASPRITQLVPVLQSPLLSIHVMVIMISYTLLAFIMLNGISAMVLRALRGMEASADVEYLAVVSRIMLYPAVALLTAGIFIGAVWANLSWGRYWGWDPKEVWALITMLIYAALIHTSSLRALRNPMTFHLFAVVAFLAVLITYFGVNFFLGGMHSYA